MDSNEKKLHEMMNKMGRMAICLTCKAVAEMIKDEQEEEALIGLAASMIGTASLVLGPCSPDDLMKRIAKAFDVVTDKIIEQQKAAMEKEGHEEKVEDEKSEPDPEPAPEPSSIPEFKGMSQEEIAASMEKIFGM